MQVAQQFKASHQFFKAFSTKPAHKQFFFNNSSLFGFRLRGPLDSGVPHHCHAFKQIELFRNNIKLFMQAEAGEICVANFVQKAFEIINNNEFSKIIQWSSNGKEFTIKDIEQFEETILPKYFRHRNINSFIRQLNMYGFHKSRKEPTKNIFSHPFFQRDKQDLLVNVRRKIKQDQNETPKKQELLQLSEEKIAKQEKPIIQKDEAPLFSCTSLAFKSSLCLEKQKSSPLKSLIERSLIMDFNPEASFKLRENSLFAHQQQDADDALSIADEINIERSRFNNRTQGIQIVRTSNFFDDFQF